MLTVWLIEYEGAMPVPTYVPEKPGWYTTNPWEAKHFETNQAATEFMEKPYGSFGVPFRIPWKAVEHCFDSCNCPAYVDGAGWRIVHEKTCLLYGR